MKLPGVVKHWQRKNLLHFGPVSLDTGCDEVRALQNAPECNCAQAGERIFV